jgi:hypothetical protein
MSDRKNSKGGAHLSDAHLPNVDEVKGPRPRQAGSMLMASARIEADANCKPGDSLTPVLRKHAATYAERVRTEARPSRRNLFGSAVALIDLHRIALASILPTPSKPTTAWRKCSSNSSGLFDSLSVPIR